MESVEKLNREDLLLFHQAISDPKNSVFSVFGDISQSEVMVLAEKYWTKKNAHEDRKEPSFKRKQLSGGMIQASGHAPREQAVVMLVFNAPDIYNKSRYAYEVLNAVIGGSAGRLYQKIRGEHGLSYVVSTDLSMNVDPGHFAFYAAVEPHQVDQTFDLFFDEVKALREEGVSDQELTDAKSKLIGDFFRELESKHRLIGALTTAVLYEIGINTYFEYEKNIQMVTKRDVEVIIAEYLDTTNSAKIVVQPDKEGVTS